MHPLLHRFSRWLLALALLPVAVGCTWALLGILLKSRAAVDFWLTLLGGGACWLVVFLLLPKPMWVYVVGHELTHALCAWLCGGRVKSMKVGSAGGQVVLTKTNALIALAPYFLPLYSLLWALIWLVVRLVSPGIGFTLVFHFGLGVTYAFHLTLTAQILRVRQPDIIGEGRVFSAVVIWLGNVLTLLFAVPLLTDQYRLLDALLLAVDRTGQVLHLLVRLVSRLSH